MFQKFAKICKKIAKKILPHRGLEPTTYKGANKATQISKSQQLSGSIQDWQVRGPGFKSTHCQNNFKNFKNSFLINEDILTLSFESNNSCNPSYWEAQNLRIMSPSLAMKKMFSSQISMKKMFSTQISMKKMFPTQISMKKTKKSVEFPALQLRNNKDNAGKRYLPHLLLKMAYLPELFCYKCRVH